MCYFLRCGTSPNLRRSIARTEWKITNSAIIITKPCSKVDCRCCNVYIYKCTLYTTVYLSRKRQELRKKCCVWRLCALLFSKTFFWNFFFNKYSYLGSFSRVSCRIACRFSRKVVVKIIESKENSSAVHILYKTNVMNVYSMDLGLISCVKMDKIIWIGPRSLLNKL